MADEQNAAGTSEKSLDKMTVKELRDVAKEISGLTGFSTMKKDDLLAQIKTSRGVDTAKPKKKHIGVKKSKKLLTVKDIKEEIVKLRGKRLAITKTGDKKNADILRRKISRLRKKSRKVGRV